MPDRHKTSPLSVRLPEAERSALLARAGQTGQKPGTIIRAAIRAYLGLPEPQPSRAVSGRYS